MGADDRRRMLLARVFTRKEQPPIHLRGGGEGGVWEGGELGGVKWGGEWGGVKWGGELGGVKWGGKLGG